ncbi:MAG: tyrosine-type recombinase/integrase [Thermomicrobiales bacterium]
MTKRRKPQQPNRTLPWGYGRIVQRGRRFHARWQEEQPDGTWKERALAFTTCDEAEDHLRAIGRRRRDGQYIEPMDRTIQDIVLEWLRRGKLRWQPSTWATYGQLAEKHVLPHIGAHPAHTITTPRLQHWIDQLVNEGLSPSYVGNARLIITGAYKQAVRGGVLRENPALGLELPTRRRSKITTWTPTEAQLFLGVVAAHPLWHALYRLALTTGLRPGELRALQWSDVDVNRGLITVRRTMTRDAQYHPVVGERTKTDQVRGVTLSSETARALGIWRTEQKRQRLAVLTWHDSDLVFTRADGRFIAQTSWQRVHQENCEKAGVPRITLHSLRHTVATIMLEQNVHPKIVSDLLGHSSIQMTLDRYSHVSTDLQRQSIDALESALTTPKRTERH